MAGAGPSTLFAGDLNDPWVLDLAESLPAGTIRLSCHERLPRSWPDSLPASLRTLILHRAIPTRSDAAILARVRAQRGPESLKVILCVGSHARFHQIERWVPLVDEVLPDATAGAVLTRHLADVPPRITPREPLPPVAIVSSLFDLGSVLKESCRAAGYPAEWYRDWTRVPRTMPAVWDVPILEPDWPRILFDQSRHRPVLCVIDLVDRETVSIAYSRGAVFCLDTLIGIEDVIFLLDRIVLSYHRDLGQLPPSLPPRRRPA